MPPRLRLSPTVTLLPLRCRPAGAQQRLQTPALCRCVVDDAPKRPPAETSNEAPSPPLVNTDSLRQGSGSLGFRKHDDTEPVLGDVPGPLELGRPSVRPGSPPGPGHKFPLPALPLPSKMHVKHRYDPILVQLTRLLMKDGKLSKAQRDMAMVLNYLRTAPPPKINPDRPLLPGSPPSTHLPLDPVLYLQLAIDSVAPLVKMRYLSGFLGGGSLLDVPVPLTLRQRRRTAFNWILDSVRNKQSRGSGRTMFPHRIAEEIVAVVEGRSGIWDKRRTIHRLGTTARANLNNPQLVGQQKRPVL